MNIEIFGFKEIKPFEFLGLTSKFWTVHIDTLIYTWVAMLILFGTILIIRLFVAQKKQNSVSMAAEQLVGFFIDLCQESFQKFSYKYFAFISSLFLFTFACCVVCLLPYMEESTKDLNTTLAIALASFFYVQYQKISAHGVIGFLKEFTEPFIVLAPIHIVGELSRIASMSFRLFGNILGGSVIFTMIITMLEQNVIPFFAFVTIATVLTALSFVIHSKFLKATSSVFVGLLFLITYTQMFVGIFEGLIQSFVLTMLTTTYLSIGVAHETSEEAHV